MSHYEDLIAAQVAEYKTSVSPQALYGMLVTQYGNGDMTAHRELALSALRCEPAGKDHPYRVFLEGIAPVEGGTGSAWADRTIRYRESLVRDVAHNGVLEPVEAFFSDNRLLYFHGHHRLMASVVSSRPTIPVRLRICGASLAALCEKLFGIYHWLSSPLVTYQPVRHPLFSLIPVLNSDLREKVNAILHTCEAKRAFADLGANLGYIARRLVEAGHTAVAVDFDATLAEAQPLLCQVGESKVPYEHTTIEAFVRNAPPLTAVMLGLVHHYFGMAERYDAFVSRIVPWMLQSELAFVEHQYGAGYAKDPGQPALNAHCVVDTAADVVAWWSCHGFHAQPLYRSPVSGRELFKLRRAE